MVSATRSPSTYTAAMRSAIRAFLLSHRWQILIAIAYCALTTAMLWPLIRTVNSAVSETDSDPLLNAWALRWVQHALLTDPRNLYNANMFAPAPKSLLFSEALLPQAITAWPIWAITRDALTSYNFSVLLTYPLCACGMYALCRALGANRGGSFVAGFLYAFAPFRMENTAHLQVLSMQGMPLTLLAVIRYVQRPSWRRGALVAATFAYTALSSVYFLVIFGTGLAVFLVVEASRQRQRLVSRVGIGLALWLLVGAGFVAVLDMPYLAMRDEQGISRTLDEAYDDAAHSDSYGTVMPGSLVWGHVLPHSSIQKSALFPGATLLLLAVIGLGVSRRRIWVWGAISAGMVGFVLSFGPTWGDKETGLPLPYRLLYQHVVAYQGLRGPDRFASLVLLALGPLAALGATALWQAGVRRRTAWHAAFTPAMLATLALTGCAVLDDAVRLPVTVPIDRSAATLAPYRWLAAQHDTGIVAEFPADIAAVRTGFFSTYHWHPVLWGHSGFVPEAQYRLLSRFSRSTDRWPGVDDIDALTDMGVRTVVIHRTEYRPRDLAFIDADFAKVPDRVRRIATEGDADIYALTPGTLDGPRVTDVHFSTTELGNLDVLPGEITVTNHAPTARMLYTEMKPRLTAEVRDANGNVISHTPIDVLLPAMVSHDSVMAVPFTVALPRAAGTYTVLVTTTHFDGWPALSPTTVHVVGLTTLPHLTLTGTKVTSPALYTAGERVAVWATLKDGRTVPLRDTQANVDRTITTDIGTVPSNAAQIVAHGTSSGVELWVSP